MRNFQQIFSGKTVLVTGHTGFKGSWLSIWLLHAGANVIGLSLENPSEPCNFDASKLNDHIDSHVIDICDADALKAAVNRIKPDFVFHLAAQALVRESYEKPLKTLQTNAMGSANLLDALMTIDSEVVVVMITSDKAYDNVEWVWGYRENDRIGGKDPYSASKGMAELAIRSYIESFLNNPASNIRVGITRAGNVIGGGDWAKDRIVPDCMNAWASNEIVDIRNPDSTRPWQHVLEPLSGYLVLAAELLSRPALHGEAYNYGPPANQNFSVRELINEMAGHWDHVRWNDVSDKTKHLHEAGLLKLNCDKALFDLNWLPTLNFKETVGMTVEWYKEYYTSPTKSMFDYSLSQIQKYCALAEARGIRWANI